jgi:hypothetical protein
MCYMCYVTCDCELLMTGLYEPSYVSMKAWACVSHIAYITYVYENI